MRPRTSPTRPSTASPSRRPAEASRLFESGVDYLEIFGEDHSDDE